MVPWVRPPGPKYVGQGSGLVGDQIYDLARHGGDDQAVYAYAREERWQVGAELVLQATYGRIPCATFQAKVGEPQWTRRFMRHARPGAWVSDVTRHHADARGGLRCV